MLVDILSNYLDSVIVRVDKLKNCYVEKYEEEILTPKRTNLRIRIRFFNGYLWELNEAVIVKQQKLEHLNCRYHFQDDPNKLVFRYDNTPHFPALNTFPHHKHLPSKVIASKQPSIIRVIDEAEEVILKTASGK